MGRSSSLGTASLAGRMRILKIIPYYGTWPIYMHLYLESCRHNPMLEVVFVTDLEPFPDSPPNVTYHRLSFAGLCSRIARIFQVDTLRMVPYKLCDFRPAYGVIFSDLIAGVDFWGYGDNDMILGRVSAFITPEKLAEYDVLSFKKGHLQGPFTLFRNTDRINNLFRDGGAYKRAFSTPEYVSFDEFGPDAFHTKIGSWQDLESVASDNISVIAFKRAKAGDIRVYSEQHGREYLQRDDLLVWRAGRVWNARTGQEYLFYHWVLEKRGIWFKYPGWFVNRPEHYYVSRTGFYSPADARAYAILHRWRLLKGTFLWSGLKAANFVRRRTGRMVTLDTYPKIGWVKDLTRPW